MKSSADKDQDSTLPSKLLLMFQFLSVLRAGRWTSRQLADHFDCSLSTAYRYIKLLDEAGFCLEKDFHDRYFILTTGDDPVHAQLTMEEVSMVRSLVQSDVQHPLKNSLLKKLSLNSELDVMPKLVLKAHLGILVEQLTHALRNQHQVILKKYHSANSSDLRDRLVEPIQFGLNYNTLIALDVEDKLCKHFKIDRIGEVVETHKTFQHKDLHNAPTSDMFGFTGTAMTTITLNLNARAYLLLREEFPLSLPFLTQLENETYTFSGPVANYAGIGRFVMGLINEIEIVEPEEFRVYVMKKLGVE